MNTAVLSSTLAGPSQSPSKIAQIATRFMTALVESRARRASQELRRHEAFLNDLSRRQDHSSSFLEQSDLLAVKI